MISLIAALRISSRRTSTLCLALGTRRPYLYRLTSQTGGGPMGVWPQAPVPAADLARALAPFGESTMLPAVAYTSAEVLAWERRYLFAGAWTCAGRVEDLFAPGDTQRAVVVGDIP